MSAPVPRALGAMALVLLTWAPLFLMFVGLGRGALRLAGVRVRTGADWLRCFWIGWVVSLAMLQVWHLVLPVDWRALVLLAALGTAGLLAHVRQAAQVLRDGLRGTWAFWLVGALVVLRIANRAIGAPLHFDSAFYHLTAIRWAATYPIVPGLGNLHPPLGINCAYFLYAALLDTGPWAGRAYHLANGLLLSVAACQGLGAMARSCRRGAEPSAYDVALTVCLPGFVGLAAIDRTIYNAMFVRWVSSPTPDLAVFVLGAMMAAELVGLVAGEGEKGGGLGLLSACALAVGGIIVKISFAVAGGLGLVFALTAWWWRRRTSAEHARRRAALLAVAFAAVALGTWAVRSVVLSGYLAYPSPAVSVPVPWRMPREAVQREAAYTALHARWPSAALAGRAQLVEGRGPDDWLVPWFRAMPKVGMHLVIVPCALALLAGCVALWLRLRRRFVRRPPWTAQLALVLPVCAGVAWFVTGPNPRFGGALFWMLASAAWALTCWASAPAPGPGIARGVAVVALLLSTYHLATADAIRPGPDHGLQPASAVRTETFTTRSGLELNVPVTGAPGALANCWDSPLPCTPRPNPALRLRRKGDMGSGFILGP